jgi:Protein of unknown function (DUF2948)
MAASKPPLRLLAQDADDLAVISAVLQDAVCLIGDIAYEVSSRQLTLALNRYRWENGARTQERVRTGLQFGGVMAVQTRNLRREAKDAVVELLSINFEPGEAPGGAMVLTFAGGGDLRAEVEMVDIIAADLSSPWPTPNMPKHDLT